MLTPQVALHHPHLKNIAGQIPEIDPGAPIMMLLGRDIIKVHKVMKHINGPREAPYALKLDLGWVIVDNVCLGKLHKPGSQCSLLPIPWIVVTNHFSSHVPTLITSNKMSVINLQVF